MRQSPCIPDQLPAIAVLSRTRVDQRDQRKQWIDYAQRNRAESARGYAPLVDFDIGLGKAAANVDRTAQRYGTGVLRFLIERQIQLLLSQIDAACTDDGGDLGVEDQRIGMHDAVFDTEIGNRTAQLDQLVAGHFQFQYFPEMQADFFHHQLADLAAGDDQSHLAVGTRKHAPYRVAFSRENELAVDLAYAGLAQLDSRKQLGNENFSRPHLRVRLDRVLTPIQRNHGIEVAAGRAKIERIERQHGIAQAQMGNEIFERQLLGAADGAGLQCYLRVDTVPAVGLERYVWQHPRLRRPHLRCYGCGCLRRR